MADPRVPHIAIVVVDDHTLFREGIARLLDAEPDIEVVGSTDTIEQGLALIGARQVDVVLLDFDLGSRNGAEFVQLARTQGYAGRILVVTAGVERHEAAALIRDGVSGIFMKNDSAARLAEGIRDVAAGKAWFDPLFLQTTMPTPEAAGAERGSPAFTARERAVLSGVFEGLANKEIADRLSVSESSVKATLQQLFRKTGVRTRSQLVRIVLEQHHDQI